MQLLAKMEMKHHKQTTIAKVAKHRLRAALVLIAVVLGTGHPLVAQWQTANYELSGGWNAIYLHGDASYAAVGELLGVGDALSIEEVWRWNGNATQTQFSNSPQQPTPGGPQWSVWIRGDPAASTLTALTGPAAYLIKCAGAPTARYVVGIRYEVTPPDIEWVRSGANLLGFPTYDNAGTYPTFSEYFATFAAPLAAPNKIFKYIGGPLGSGNPLQIFSPTFERLERNKAYWFEAQVVGNYYSPLQVTLSQLDGLHYGRTRTMIIARLFNRTAQPMTVRIANEVSEPAPVGQQAITGAVPLTRRVFNSTTALWEEVRITGPYEETIAANSSIELGFGVDRTAMAAADDSYYASLLRLRDDGGLSDLYLPVSAQPASLAGLWIGEALVRAVESKAQADAITPTGQAFPLRYLMHIGDDANATVRILSQVYLGELAAPPNAVGITTKEAGLNPAALDTALRLVATHMPLDLVLEAGTGAVTFPGTLTRTIALPHTDPSNPFLHQYHPDHDNKSPQGTVLASGIESYTVTRELTFQFTTSPPPGSTETIGWGTRVIGGTYEEIIHGLHKDSAGVGSGDGLHLTGTFELRRISEIGTLSIVP